MYNLYDYTLDDLTELVVSMQQKPFRARQLYKWLYDKKETNFELYSDVSKDFRQVLFEKFEIKIPEISVQQNSSDGTIKLLLELEDGNKIETVLMRYRYGNVACVTSQVGCNMGCGFCASGILKKKRDLEVKEMVGQIIVLNNLLKEEGNNERVTHVVVMGTGEPFDNYYNVMKFIRIINSPYALEIGARHITVSTCGIPDKIREYANEGLQTNLAISLHAPNDEIRNKLMPINRKYPLKELMDAILYYEKKAGRRVTFEYILLDGINDSIENAKELRKLIKNTFNYVNLIPYNSVNENKYRRSTDESTRKFFDLLAKSNVNVTVRREFGADIDAACGQLRAKEEK